MRKRSFSILLVLISALTIFASDALAQGRGRGSSHARGRVEVRVDTRDFDRRDRGRVVIVNDRIFVQDCFDGRPPGWDRGRKVGWGNCNLPPGQAKKYGCDSRIIFHDRVRHRPSVRVVIPLR
jgi:hypothetical protein